MNCSGKIHALLSTARVANIPSVICNVWLGIAFTGGGFFSHDTALLMAAGVSLYVAGNFLNDWMDRAWDETNRPERALPRGLFVPASYLCVASLAAVSGVACAASVGWRAALVALLISLCIIIYTIFHKRAVWSVVPMGMCRALLPVMGALGVSNSTNPLVLLPAAALFFYIVGLSLSARNEAHGGEAVVPALWFLVPPALLVSLTFHLLEHRMIALVGLLPYGLWIWKCRKVDRRPVSRYVSSLLAGIPLVDWLLLLPLSIAGPPSIACIVIPPLAVLSAVLLQRVAPAT